MTKNQPWLPLVAAAALLALPLAAAGPAPTVQPFALLPSGADIPDCAQASHQCCTHYSDDWGWGGSDVSCTFACPAHAALAVGVVAKDEDATAYGGAACGNANAACDDGTISCSMASTKLTEYTDGSTDDCSGGTHETWDSGVTIGCVAVGADVSQPTEFLCEQLHICPGQGYACVEMPPYTAVAYSIEQVTLSPLPTGHLVGTLVEAMGTQFKSTCVTYRLDCSNDSAMCTLLA